MSNYRIETDIVIKAPTSKVWHCLQNLKNYGVWNQFITNVRGDLRGGAELDLEIRPLGKTNQKYKVLITELNHECAFSWLGHFHVKGLIDGHHTFELSSIDNHSTLLIHREKFTGILVPFVWTSFILPRLKPGFLVFNSGLKKYLEK